MDPGIGAFHVGAKFAAFSSTNLSDSEFHHFSSNESGWGMMRPTTLSAN